MKNINITFEDSEYKDLVKTKNGLNWRTFILTMLSNYKKKEVVNGRTK